MRRAVLAAVLGVALASSACIPPEPDEDRIINFREDTVMGQVQARGRLRIAVPPDQPPWSSVDGEAQGFLVDMGRWIADELGVEAEFTVVGTTAGETRVGDTIERLVAMVRDEQVEVAFPNLPITADRVRSNIGFTDPYFVGHHRLLVPAGSTITGVGDLAGRTVCSVMGDPTDLSMDELAPEADVTETPFFEECAALLGDRSVDAVVASDVFLVQIAARLGGGFEIVGDQLSTIGYGAVVPAGTSGWADFINSTLGEAKREERWTQRYEAWIATYIDRTHNPPTLTAEEAAALFPEET